MAEATAKKRGRPKKAEGNGDVTLGSTDAHPDQNQLEGFEEERVPEIENIVSAIVNNKTRIKELQLQNKEHFDELAGQMHEHDLKQYRCMGRVVVVKPGEETIEIKKAKGSKAE